MISSSWIWGICRTFWSVFVGYLFFALNWNNDVTFTNRQFPPAQDCDPPDPGSLRNRFADISNQGWSAKQNQTCKYHEKRKFINPMEQGFAVNSSSELISPSPRYSGFIRPHGFFLTISFQPRIRAIPFLPTEWRSWNFPKPHHALTDFSVHLHHQFKLCFQQV